ncbi:TetR/AcrR family transcriptional regulator [Aestuariibius sp. 2305UL40-4]|uniref:TetR/AcrR family transcriptional regulator n=1 Tax=Aestuariibius violaceus TaxID=3234132 RepID=UPI00345EBFD4
MAKTNVRTPQQSRSQKRVDEILAAAHRLIARDGISATTMKAIATDAGVSMASIYQYFRDQDAIVAELCRMALTETGRLMEGRLTPPPSTLPEMLEICVALLHDHYRLLRDEPVFRAVWLDRARHPALRELGEEDELRSLSLLLRQAEGLVGVHRWPKVRTSLRILFEMSLRGVEVAVQASDGDTEELLNEVEEVVRATWTARVE